MPRFLVRFLVRLREARYAAGTLRLFFLAPSWLIRRKHLVFEIDIGPETTAGEVSGAMPPLSWEQLTGNAVRELIEINPLTDLETLEAREREGQTCFAARANNKIIHYRWYAANPTWLPFLHLTWSPEDGDYTLLGAFTHPSYRNRGVIKALLGQGLARARTMGYRRLVSFIADWNAPSIRATTRGGMKPAGSVTFWNLGFMRWHSTTGNVRVENGRLRVLRRE